MYFNHKQFFDGTRIFLQTLGRGLTQERVGGLEFMLAAFEKDAHWQDVRHIAYALATTCIETDWKFEPISEYGTYARFEKLYGYQTRKGRELGNDAPGEGAKYSGKGYEQLTGESNYEKAETELRRQYPHVVAEFETRTGQHFDLTDFPNQAKDREIAFAIMTLGMFQGWFTGRKLSDYINSRLTDYRNARRIINGIDRAGEIAGFAVRFEKILTNALKSEIHAGNVAAAIDSISTDQPDGAAATHSPQGNPSTTSVEKPSAPPVADNADRAGDSNNSDNNVNATTTQTAENITNVNNGSSIPADFVPDNLTVTAPPPSGIMSKARIWVASIGIGVPTLAGSADAVKGFFADSPNALAGGFSVAAAVAKFVFPYVIYLAIAFVIFWGLKELLKQMSLIVKIYTTARADMNNVEVEPVKPIAYIWSKAELPELMKPVSIIEGK